MLPKTMSHMKWICFVSLLICASLWLELDIPAGLLQGQPGKSAYERMASASSKQAKPNSPASAKEVEAGKPAVSSGTQQAAGKTQASDSAENRRVRTSFKFFPNTNRDLSKYKAVEVIATGYYAGEESTGKSPGHPGYGLTYSGLKVIRDESSISTIAADPKVFPIGTVLWIPGYGYGVVADTGGAVKGNKIDLYFETKSQVYKEWGKKTLDVFIVRMGEGKITEAMWNQIRDEIKNLAV